MADDFQSRPINRDKLATFLKSPELIRAFEAWSADLTANIPAAVKTAEDAAVAAQASADQAQDAADAAAMSAQQAQLVASQALSATEAIVQSPIEQIAAMREQISALTAVVKGLQQGIQA